MIADLRHQADRKQDSADRHVARRAIAGMYIGSIESANERMQAKDYAEAARHFEVALLLRPDAAGTWYMLARGQGGKSRQARRAGSTY